MSMHRSLAISSKGRKHRNVLTREERLAKLKEAGRWDEGKSVFGLPKVRSIKQVTTKKKVKKVAAEGEAVVGEGAGDAAAAPGAEAADAK